MKGFLNDSTFAVDEITGLTVLEFIHGSVELDRGHKVEGPIYCCELGCHLEFAMIEKRGDDLFCVWGLGPTRMTEFAQLTMAQTKCLAGVDFNDECPCQGGHHE